MASDEFEHVRSMFLAQANTSKTPRGALDVESLRAASEQSATMFPLPDTARVDEVEIGGSSAFWVCAPGARTENRLLYLHGGGYVSGSFASFGAHVARLAELTGAAVLFAEYPLAPEHSHPAQLDHALACYRHLLEAGPTEQTPARRVFAAGDSAGGGLTLATLLALRDAGDRLPDAAVGLSIFADLTGSGESVETRKGADILSDPALIQQIGPLYAPGRDWKDPLLSPVFGDPTGLPPILLHVGDCEVLLSDTTRFAERSRAAGVDVTLKIWPEMFHVFHLWASVFPEAREAMDEVAAFIRTHSE